MAFDGLASKLQDALKKLKGKGKLTEKDIKEAMREVKLALLEADVNYKVVKQFVSSVSEKCINEEILGILDRKSTRLNSSHSGESRMPSSA